MPNRLACALNSIESEQEAPMYALERLRFAVAQDATVEDVDAKRLEALDRSGEGRAFGSGWMDFLAFAMTIRDQGKRR